MRILMTAILCQTTLFSISNAQTADTVYTGGKIYTVNEVQPWAEAVAIKDGKFIAVGSNAEIEAFKGEATKTVDLKGKFVMPGIHDAHVHPPEVYKNKEAGNLIFPESSTVDEIKKAIQDFAEANPEMKFIRGEKYSLGAFPGGKMPKEFLDEIIRDRSVLIYDESFHNATANSKALELAGITKDTPNPPLGSIDKDPDTGEPTGYISETGIGLVARYVTRVNEEQLKRATEKALGEMTALGITAFIDMLGFKESVNVYRSLEQEGKLPFRAVVATALNEYTDEVATADEALEFVADAPALSTKLLDTNHFKYWADGTPTSYTSLLVDPYTNKPSELGSMTMTEGMLEKATELMGKGVNGHFHSIGDGTSRRILDLIEAVRKNYPSANQRVHIGHNMLVHPDDIPRYKELNVVAEFSPPQWFPTPASPLMPSFLGDERTARVFPVKEFVDARVPVAYGSDWPAGTPTANPWRSLEGLVTRKDPAGVNPGQLGEPITLKTALHMMTYGGAYAMQQEDEHGSIEVGKYADMIVLDQNLFDLEKAGRSDRISSSHVLKTIFAGAVVYDLIKDLAPKTKRIEP